MAHRPDSLVIRNSVDNRMTEQKRLFITTLEKVATVTVACKAVGIVPSTAYLWKKEDTLFSEQWDNALTYAFEALESATYLKLAHVLQTDSKRLSTAEARLIELFLAGAKPEKYRQRAVEIDNSQTTNLTIDWSQVPDDIFNAFKRNELTLEDVYQHTIKLREQQKTPSDNEGA